MSDAVIIALIAAGPPTLVAFISLVISWRNGSKLGDLHILVNSRLTQLLTETAKSNRAEGVIEGKESMP